ncbi:MAG: sigma-54-dependent Fis family transcriptional regulator [Acidobacteria bacterium]|nr:MAG: sigma-54-dependent Fis family transcriptional regulator [Acidobacteriota bacterium]
MTPSARILLIDDDAAGRTALRRALQRMNYEVEAHAAGAPALKSLGDGTGFDLVITDIKMPGMDGLELLRRVKEANPELPVILITAFGTIENAVEAISQGASDYLTKPLGLPEVRAKVAKTLESSHIRRENRRLKGENERLRKEAKGHLGLQALVGVSPAMEHLKQQLLQVAPTPSSVLVVGESGTGKELVARALHDESARASRQFLPINCAAIPHDILESELFGHERGAFTGAVGRKPGKFEVASGGTLLLDEVGEMPLGMQAKLLRVLEEKSFMRVGGVDTIKVDVRIVAATNANLEQLVAKGEFRADLYYRLKVITLTIPPLRERKEDIPVLIGHFLERLSREYQRPGLNLSRAAIAALEAGDWPGNIRELRNMLESLVVLSNGPDLGLGDLPPEYGGTPETPVPVVAAAPAGKEVSAATGTAAPTYEAGLPMAELEKRHILRTLAEQDNNRTRAARVLGIGRRTLQRKLEEYKEEGELVPPPAPD